MSVFIDFGEFEINVVILINIDNTKLKYIFNLKLI